jgi:hypothetical protein
VGDRHQIEFFATILLRLCQAITGRRLSPERVRFTHRRSTASPELATLFACDIQFGAAVDEVVFPLSAKSTKIVNADPYLNTLLLQYCDDIMTQRRLKSELAIQRQKRDRSVTPAWGSLDGERRAASPGGRRTLARRLASNVTFSGLLNELRRGLATRYLHERDSATSRLAPWLSGFQRVQPRLQTMDGASPELRSSG